MSALFLGAPFPTPNGENPEMARGALWRPDGERCYLLGSAMARKAREITADRLHERMANEAWPKELCALASAFDEMLARLEESFVRLSTFSADLAHDLRTPLNRRAGQEFA